MVVEGAAEVEWKAISDDRASVPALMTPKNGGLTNITCGLRTILLKLLNHLSSHCWIGLRNGFQVGAHFLYAR